MNLLDLNAKMAVLIIWIGLDCLSIGIWFWNEVGPRLTFSHYKYFIQISYTFWIWILLSYYKMSIIETEIVFLNIAEAYPLALLYPQSSLL